jgi:hypothetical protein
MRHYRVSSLDVAADVDLPFAEPGHAGPEPDVTIRRGDVPSVVAPATASGPFWTMDARRLLLTVPGVMRCLVADGREITYEPASGIDAADVVPFVMGTAFGVLLHQRGLLVLQASAVMVDGHAVLVCGPSGSGKSTLAAALSQRGFPILADDVCVIEFDQAGAPCVRPESRYVRLWGRTIGTLSLEARKGPPLRSAIQKFYVDAGTPAVEEACPLRAVYRLQAAGGPHRAGIVRYNPAEAAITLRRCAYRPRYVAASGRRAEQFQHVARVAGRAGVFDLRRVLTFDALPGTVDALAAHWRDLGLESRV